jgi:hypothetical protein
MYSAISRKGDSPKELADMHADMGKTVSGADICGAGYAWWRIQSGGVVRWFNPARQGDLYWNFRTKRI